MFPKQTTSTIGDNGLFRTYTDIENDDNLNLGKISSLGSTLYPIGGIQWNKNFLKKENDVMNLFDKSKKDAESMLEELKADY